MKIQGLAVLAIIIILPMVIILNAYSSNQIKTLDLQTSYDSKLTNATYDAIKALQLNMSNSSTSDIVNSKMRDIEASITTFYNSLASNFNMSGYGKDTLKNYVPAVVYTMYDGYYIYSTYTNKLDSDDSFDANASYKDGEKIDGLKPYIYYSCRYKNGSNYDFVITYSLDSYITIQGIVNGNEVNDSGYLLTGVGKTASGKYTYRGVEISAEVDKEGLKQNVYEEGATSGGTPVYVGGNLVGSIINYPCRKINGVKNYKGADGKVFSIINDEKLTQPEISANSITKNTNAVRFYKEAYEFKKKILGTGSNDYNLGGLNSSWAVDKNGNKYSNTSIYSENPYTSYSIFGELNSTGKYIEDDDSNFNAHKLQVIRNSIESNLIPSISNYNKVSTSGVNFAMPRLEDYEWEKLTKNVSMITFLQGLNIGGKIYNGHAIVTNDKTEDYVSEDSIYILDTSEKQYYSITDSNLLSKNFNNLIGILNIDFDRRTGVATNEAQNIDKNIYYYPKSDYASYSSIINRNGNSNRTADMSISDYLESITDTNVRNKLKQIYYTALGRERCGMYRVGNKVEEITQNKEYNIRVTCVDQDNGTQLAVVEGYYDIDTWESDINDALRNRVEHCELQNVEYDIGNIKNGIITGRAYYKRLQYTVTINYKDKLGNKIAEPKIMNYPEGLSYTIPTEYTSGYVIPGYEYYEISGATSGVCTNNITINVFYKIYYSEYNIKITCVDQDDGTQLAVVEGKYNRSTWINDVNNSLKNKIDHYTFQNVDYNTNNIENGSITGKAYYKRIQHTATINYKDTLGNKIAESKTINYPEGLSYTIPTKYTSGYNIPGYKYYQVSGETSGVCTNDIAITVSYKIDKKVIFITVTDRAETEINTIKKYLEGMYGSVLVRQLPADSISSDGTATYVRNKIKNKQCDLLIYDAYKHKLPQNLFMEEHDCDIITISSLASQNTNNMISITGGEISSGMLRVISYSSNNIFNSSFDSRLPYYKESFNNFKRIYKVRSGVKTELYYKQPIDASPRYSGVIWKENQYNRKKIHSQLKWDGGRIRFSEIIISFVKFINK